MTEDTLHTLPYSYFSHRDLLIAPELASELMTKMITPARIEPLNIGGMFDSRFSFGTIPNVHFWSVDIRQGFSISLLGKDDRQIIYFPGAGVLTLETAQGTYTSDETCGAIVEAAGCRRMLFFEGRQGIGVAVDRPALLQRLASLLDAPVRRRLEFAPRFEAEQARHGAVADLVRALISPGLSAAVTASPVVAAKLSTIVLDLVLQSLPHNYSEDLLTPPKRTAPRHVKDAMDYIDKNAHLPLTIDDIAAVSQVSIRSLQYSFQRFLDVSPATYLRSARLEGARRMLSDHEEMSLTQIAGHWSFTNLSRFVARFKAAYGETPAEFRRRRPSPPKRDYNRP